MQQVQYTLDDLHLWHWAGQGNKEIQLSKQFINLMTFQKSLTLQIGNLNNYRQ